MVQRIWNSRWARALVVAVAVALWPACALDSETHTDPAVVKARLDFTLKDMSGRDVNLADFKGRPILINFWATWCPPCKAEIPWFIEFAEKHKAKNLVILGISVDDPPDEIRKFAEEQKVNYPMLVGLGHDQMLEVYEATFAIPVSWFIRADGTVAGKAAGIHSREWFEQQLKAIF
jgi:thiol-disulfide isomerase/thioredoxin